MGVPAVEKGRGAWTATGKDNGSRYYEHIAGSPLDGASPSRDVNYLAVHLGVRAIQRRINKLGYTYPLTVDGALGAKTAAGIRWAQKRSGLREDGQVGQVTAKALWRGVLAGVAGATSVPTAHLWGIMMAESGADPGAVGYTTPSDRGLFQINIAVHTDISAAEAHDPLFAAKYTNQRLLDARTRFGGKGSDLQTKCSIAQHNAPAWAAQWYSTGKPPNERIAAYVEKVLTWAMSY